jgi:uncharacterized protein YndB with AHSA1/START domain
MNPTPRAVARVSRTFAASPERVFDSWLDPEKVHVWWKASAAAAGRGATETVERILIDARQGGSFSFLVRRDGQLIDHTGTYLEIDRPRRLVFTWAARDIASSGDVVVPSDDPDSPDYSRVTIDITPLPSGCEVTLSHEMHPDWKDFVDRAVNAWRIMLDAIDELVSEVPTR